MFRRSAIEMRVIILAPIGRDAALLANTLGELKIEAAIARDSNGLLELLPQGVGSAIVAEEALTRESMDSLNAWLSAQPAWSDMPFIVLSSNGRPTRESNRKALEFESLGNFTIIERPVRQETIKSAVRTALRARMRQYEIRSRQEALIRANADLEQFAHSASHDLREPLRGIGIYSDLLERDYAALLDARGIEFLNSIRTGAKRMDALLNDLLQYAHASSIVEEDIEPVPVTAPLKTALENLAMAIRESGAQITIGEMPVVRMHESHLSQIFQNLIENAIKYRSESQPPQIGLSASRTNSHWTISVADNGIGVPAAYRETIFGIFKRLHSNGKYSGTGMGLAICQRIVERYRGRIWVESEPGHGSTFFFTIPA